MKAPDKIYINKFEANVSEDTKSIGVAFTEQLDTRFIEYIRKDALLEWAKHRLENLNNVNFNEDNYDAGKSHILSDLIDKVNTI